MSQMYIVYFTAWPSLSVS